MRMLRDFFKAFVMVTFLWCCAAIGSCAHGPILPVIYDCASKQTAELEKAVIDILGADNYDIALADLAAALGTNGLQMITCVVKTYLAKPQTAYAQAVKFDIARSHASLWLAAHSK